MKMMVTMMRGGLGVYVSDLNGSDDQILVDDASAELNTGIDVVVV